MSAHNITVDGEFRYIIQWFYEWSELQREDFFEYLVEYLAKDNGAIYMNGVVSSMANSTCNDKPMSLFQCRIKLFNEWNKKWPGEFKNKLKEKIIEIDPKYGEKLNEDLNNVVKPTNGTLSPSPPPAEDFEPEPEPVAAPLLEESNGIPTTANEEITQSA